MGPVIVRGDEEAFGSGIDLRDQLKAVALLIF